MATINVGAICHTSPVSTPAESAPVDVARLVEKLTHAPGRADRLQHLEVLPARAATHAEWPDWVRPEVRAAYQRRGIERPWRHQRAAAEAVRCAEHVILATGTSSGKSLAYQLPAISSILDGRGTRGERGATVLYLSPTKALAQDQLANLTSLATGIRVATHDGDSSRDERAWTREHAEYVLTNPDMLHHSLLGTHAKWARFLGALTHVVIDECHHYRGVFGAHVAHILRRLRRVCASYGAHPTFVLASATVAEPARTASLLTGLDVRAMTQDDSPRGQTSLLLWEPALIPGGGENGAPVRRAASSEVAELLADLVAEEVRTLAFVRSRRGVEQVAMTARSLLAEVDPTLASKVAGYRGGYLQEERRDLEAALREGSLIGLAATNALELGIDISGLDTVLIAGFPGTRAAFWQQIGRAGRGERDALAILVAREDPLDTYLVTHPDSLIGAPVEAVVFDPANKHILGPHLCAAAQELPLSESDLALFADTAGEVVDYLTAAGLLRKRPRGWFWTDRGRASDLADIRSIGSTVQIVEAATAQVIGTIEWGAAHNTAHPGAVYVHRGETWLVKSLDLDNAVAVIERSDPSYSTTAREVTDIKIASTHEQVDWGDSRLCLGEVEVTHQVVSYLQRRVPGGEVIGEQPLDLPARTLRTNAVWWIVPDELLSAADFDPLDLPGAAHAAEHCAIAMLPLFATCDRWDIGGVSTALHPDTGCLTVFVYDGHPGGAGFAERGFQAASDWLSATRDAIASCECSAGCPSCIQSPKCGNQNNPLDKVGAIRLLDVLLTGAPTT